MMSNFGEAIEDYEILEHLGKGGFANVYKARCRRTGLFVAIKMIDKGLMANAGMIGRVRQEVTIHSRLKHPAILELYTFFEDVHYVYLVLELAHNGELAKHFKLSTHGISEKAAADIFRQVVSGVLYLHTHNIIHRDLSLNNLLLTKDLIVKIADFGLATQLNEPDEKHVTMCGTPNYISPEVASRELHGLPTDVWGLGCMLYTLLVGRPPFHTQHVKTTLNKVINADYKIPSNLSFEAQDLLQKLLCKDPTKRIKLKGIMEHPFLNKMILVKQDFSRDSGCITTTHSSQHSCKSKSVNKLHDNHSNCNESVNFIFQQKDTKPEMGINYCSAQSSSASNNFYKIFSNHGHSGEGLKKKHINFSPLTRIDSNIMEPKLQHDSVKTQTLPTRAESVALMTTNDDKENKPKHVCTNNSNSLGVPPLCSERLPSISHRTRNAILKIEPTGVVVEFIKRKGKDREEKVVEVCKISKDGMKVFIFNTDVNKLKTEDTTNPDEIYSYHNLPQKHWKKYLYASRFVDLVKAKTPKITLYSKLAKCQLMENTTDIDLFFYSGEKVTFNSTEGLKIIDKNLKTYNDLTATVEHKYLTDHFEECSNRMKRILEALSCIPDDCFPLIIGKRPLQSLNNVELPNIGSAKNNYNTPLSNVGSFQRTMASSTQGYSDFHIT